jgi:putative hydrolase of the HAD superfamily
MIKVIAFDADDTLWHNETLYHQAKEDITQILAGFRNPQEVKAYLDQIEVANIIYYGYGIKSFILSMIETATQISGGQVTSREIDQILSIAKDMLTAPVELVAGVEDTLSSLFSAHDLLLITKGDQFEQERKIRISGISHYFRYLEIVGEKSADVYLSILDKYQIDVSKFLMVGNSLRSDILPVLEIGGQAVYIPNELTWFHENADHQEIDGAEYIELQHITQLPEMLRTRFPSD